MRQDLFGDPRLAAAIEPGRPGLWFSGGRSDGAQIVGRGLTRLPVSNNVECDLLSFVEPMHPGAFDRADVHEDIFTAVIRLDEAEALLDIEPLHGSLRHLALLSLRVSSGHAVSAAGSFEFWRKVVSPTRDARRGQVVRPKLDRSNVGYCGFDRKGPAPIFWPADCSRDSLHSGHERAHCAALFLRVAALTRP